MQILLGQAPAFFWWFIAPGALIFLLAAAASIVVRSYARLTAVRGQIKITLTVLKATMPTGNRIPHTDE